MQNPCRINTTEQQNYAVEYCISYLLFFWKVGIIVVRGKIGNNLECQLQYI